MPVRNGVENEAVAFVIRHLRERERYAVEDVSRSGAHKGYDLIARKEGKEIKIEVKGCSVLWGIPDPYVTEFDEKTRRLVADFLYVAYFIGNEPPRLCVIPRDAIDPDMVTPRYGYRISGKFKKESVMRKFLVPT